MDDTLFHRGERVVQERTGESEIARINSRMIRPHIPPASRAFVGEQRLCIIGGASAAGLVHAAILAGEPGFVQASEDLTRLAVRLDALRGAARTTPPLEDLRAGQSLAMLLIDLQTRRRLRINGQVRNWPADELGLQVQQAFPVCPRYIQKRTPEGPASTASATTEGTLSGEALNAATSEWIAAADTLFIASLGLGGEADVSHRGGRRGFVEVKGETIRFPDYNGNSMFNTLGNLEVEPRCGIAIPDFENARQLQLTGHARAHFHVAEDEDRTGGTGRWIEFTVESWRATPMGSQTRWRFVEASPHNP